MTRIARQMWEGPNVPKGGNPGRGPSTAEPEGEASVVRALIAPVVS